MRRIHRAACAIAALAAGQAMTAHAQVIESFEEGISGYTRVSGPDDFETRADSARHGPKGGLFGATSASFFYNPAIKTEAGRTYRAWVRQDGSGRAYLGVGASSDGAFSVVLASNTQELLLQNNASWGYIEHNKTKVSVETGVWYQLEIEWGATGVMVGRVYNASGTLLAETLPHDSGLTGAGGLAFRGLGGFGVSFDGVQVVDRGCYADCDASGSLDFFDFLCFQDQFAAQSPSADCDSSGSLDFFDFLCFQNAFAAGCQSGLNVIELGTSAPSIVVDGRSVTPVAADARPLGQLVTDVSGAGCGKLLFSESLKHHRIGSGWATWSHGYKGDVYFSEDGRQVTIGLPPSTTRFTHYVQPEPFADVEFEISAVGVSGTRRLTDTIHGSSGAKGYAFSDDEFLAGVTVRPVNGETAFAIGEFLIRTECGDLRKLGTIVPPTSMCFPSRTLTNFPLDGRPTYTDVASVPTPLGGQIEFSYPLSHRRIGDGWSTWSHGYEGDVYRTVGFNILRVDLPKGTSAFRMGIEPAPFSDIDFEISMNNGVRRTTATINGQAAAQGFGFCGDVKNVEVTTTSVKTDFAIGEFAIAK